MVAKSGKAIQEARIVMSNIGGKNACQLIEQKTIQFAELEQAKHRMGELDGRADPADYRRFGMAG